ncbi:MAG: serine protease [Comamonadaceae bacterium]|nr:serine protease [Comamonadaceae bacterium]
MLGTILGCGGGEDTKEPVAASALISTAGLTEPGSTDPRLEQIREVMRPKSAANATDAATVVRLGDFQRVQQPSSNYGALMIGAARDVEATTLPEDFHSRLSWRVGVDGKQTASISFESLSASGIRLGLQIDQLPMRSVFRVSGSDDEPAVEVDSSAIAQIVQLNLNAGVDDQTARLYWLPSVNGARATLEIDLPADIPRSAMALSIPKLIHIWSAPGHSQSEGELTKGAAASCHRDVGCSTSFDKASKSVARMTYVKDGENYSCSGALMADWHRTQTPYFLSAAHCISSQEVASTLETDWFYKSASCGSSIVDPSTRHRRGGATLLYVGDQTDTAFMRLNVPPPSEAIFARGTLAYSTPPFSVTGLHHPKTDYQKISMGAAINFDHCTPEGLELECKPTTDSTAKFLRVKWDIGSVEPGSSGSPLFVEYAGEHHVVGQLNGGSKERCGDHRRAWYGRFDLAYEAGLKQWLGPDVEPPPTGGELTPVFRFFNASTGAHFYTNSVLERDFVISTYPAFHYEGPTFSAFPHTGPGLAPVYRFFNIQTSAHFYSNSAAERDYVLDTYPQFQYEGPTWYARPEAGNNAHQMHRFFHLKNGVHFYTLDQAEADFVRATYADWKYEGGVYYAWPN